MPSPASVANLLVLRREASVGSSDAKQGRASIRSATTKNRPLYSLF
ncbi:MAG: hypothetical protein ACRD06_06045 [Terriglobia bacterium]